jgi:hypothetical protein
LVGWVEKIIIKKRHVSTALCPNVEGVSKYQEPIKYNKYVEMWVALLCKKKKKEMLSRNVVWCFEEPNPRGYAKLRVDVVVWAHGV